MKAMNWSLCLALLLSAEPALAAATGGPAEICASRDGVAQSGVATTFIGAPLGVTQDALDESGCTTVEQTEGPYVWLLNAVTTPIAGNGGLSICMTRNAVAEVGKTVALVVPPSSVPVTAVTDASGCANFAAFRGVYAAVNSSLVKPQALASHPSR